MTATEEPTLYDVLEVDPASSLDELRAAVERARETYGQESLAVYALVDEGQLQGLRAKLDEAAAVLLDPARKASYDRSIGRLGPATLWDEEEEEEEEEEALPPLEAGPHRARTELELEAGSDEEEEEEEEPEQRQQALALGLSETPGPFGRGAESAGPALPQELDQESSPAGSAAPAPLLSADWAAAVPTEQPAARPSPEPERESVAAPAAVEAEAPRAAETLPEGSVASPDPAPSGLPPPLGLRIKPGAPPPAADAEPPSPPERPPELPGRSRESRLRLDIPPDVEFNGEMLRRVRESYGLSLQQVAERTRITRIHLENVEADRYDRLPATVYLRGILVNLARELRLDPARVSKTYLLTAQRAHARAP